MFYITVSVNTIIINFHASLIKYVQAREDALKVKKLVASSFKSRQVKALLHDGPEPTQRTLDSFTSVRMGCLRHDRYELIALTLS